MSLSHYKTKRNFSKTPEPDAKKATPSDNELLRFVVQKHKASHLHYDFRLELNGVLKSWAVPKGPSLNPDDKRLAMMVEDHPYDYRTFEGVIPKGNYGAGQVIIWDEGFYSSLETTDKKESEKIIRKGLAKGHLSFILNGSKLHGEFSLVKINADKDDASWLLIKKRDAFADTKDITHDEQSVVSGKRIEDITENNSTPKHNKNSFRLDVRPMLASVADRPFNDPNWLFELKWDGYRAIAEIADGEAALYSRNSISFTKKYPELTNELKKIKHNCILDGEIVVLDETGKPQFQWLQHYNERQQGILAYYVFDILALDGKDLKAMPLLVRKKRLQEILPSLTRIHYCHHIIEHGVAFYDSAIKEKLEGIIAKRSDSTYTEGIRSTDWLKIKRLHEQTAIIGGFTEPRGNRKALGALLLGVYEGNDFVYIGHTGGGLDDKQLVNLRKKLEKHIQASSPFKTKPIPNAPVQWVTPTLACRVQFSEWTEDGVMRQPIFMKLLTTVNPKNIRREQPNPPTFFSPIKEQKTVPYGSHRLTITNTSKILWPEDGYTKQDLITYYENIAEYILPYMYNRPQSLNRHPNGIHGESFFQKNAGDDIPNWIERYPIRSDTEERTIHYILCNDLPTLIYLANLGCIEFNVWNTTIDHLTRPDYLVIDLDPGETSFVNVVLAAQETKKILDAIDAVSFVKTSGKTGLHIYIPLGAAYTDEQVRSFAELLMRLVHQVLPDTTSVERNPSKRIDKVYLDFLQNRRGQTMAAPYCLRPVPGALVSTPLSWREVTSKLDPRAFTIRTIFKRLSEKGDLWKDLFKYQLDMSTSLKKLAQL